jgi:hypothetical protein
VTWRLDQNVGYPTNISIREQEIIPQAPTDLRLRLSFPPSGQGVLRIDTGRHNLSNATPASSSRVLSALQRLPLLSTFLSILSSRSQASALRVGLSPRRAQPPQDTSHCSCWNTIITVNQFSGLWKHEALRDLSIDCRYVWPRLMNMCVASKVDSKADSINHVSGWPPVSIEKRPSATIRS